jgi:mannose-6-phosphate isomerase-like protein (cupin superfamily)
VLLSLLPEDGRKAAEPGYHPGSTEVYVTFQGSLVMECLVDGDVRDTTVVTNDVLILPPGQCHRVRHDRHGRAASLIVKTNLGARPRVVRCDDCTYYRDKNDCSLHERWRDDVEE